MIPIASQRRKPYLIIFALIAFLLENCLYFFDPEKKTVLILLFLIALSFVFCNVVTEAMLVELSSDEHTARNVSLFFGMRAVGGLIYTIIQLNSPLHHRNSTQSDFIRFPVFVHPPPSHCSISYFLPREGNSKSNEYHWSQKRDPPIPWKTNHIQTYLIHILFHGNTITINFNVLFLHQPIEIKWWLFQHSKIYL